MASRYRRRLAALLTVVLTACASAGNLTTTTATTVTTTTSTTATTTTTSTSTTTTSTTTTTTTTTVPTTTTTPTLTNLGTEVLVPDGDGPFPAVVLAHGGGWVAGSPGEIRALARYLTDAGYLTVNAGYKLSNNSPGFPQAIDDIACAVRFAAAHPDSDGSVAMVGYSAGAHLGAIVALTGDSYAADCPWTGTGVPERFVGLAGPYDVSRLGILMYPFFGATSNAAPGAWAAGNPQRLTDENPLLQSLIVYGELDEFVTRDFAVNFHGALVASGSESELDVVAHARHIDMAHPLIVGDLILEWLGR